MKVVSFPKPASSKRPARGAMIFLTPEEMLALLRAAREHSTRAWAMILLAYRHGMRASEVCGLKLADVDLKAGSIVVRRLKGSLQTMQPLFPHRGQPLLDECAAGLAARAAGRWLRRSLREPERRQTRSHSVLSPVPSNCCDCWPACREKASPLPQAFAGVSPGGWQREPGLDKTGARPSRD